MSDAPTTTRPCALVTGASSGIGLELAKQFAQHGWDVVVTAEDAELEAAAEQVRALGAGVQAVRADLTRYDGVEELYAALRSTGRPLDAAALNAGVGVAGRFTETDLAAELGIVQLNIASTVHLAKRLVPDMVARGEGRLLFTSSTVSRMPAPFQLVYGGSKAFVQSFAQGLRQELADTGVSVTALLPGPTETEFFERADAEDTKVGAASKDSAAQVAEQGYEGLMAGKDHVVAGSLKTRLTTHAAAVTPDVVGAKQHASMSEPGSSS